MMRFKCCMHLPSIGGKCMGLLSAAKHSEAW